MTTKMKVVDKEGRTVRLNDKERSLLDKLEPKQAQSICAGLNNYRPLSALAPFRVEEDR